MTNLSLCVQYASAAPELPRWRIRRWLQRALDMALPADAGVILTVRLVDEAEGRELNLAWRGRDYATNVLSFEYGPDPSGTISGDIAICLPVLAREAADQGKPLLHHAAHLLTHGALHCLGFDHIEPDQASAMEALETRILRAQKIPDPYQ